MPWRVCYDAVPWRVCSDGVNWLGCAAWVDWLVFAVLLHWQLVIGWHMHGRWKGLVQRQVSGSVPTDLKFDTALKLLVRFLHLVKFNVTSAPRLDVSSGLKSSMVFVGWSIWIRLHRSDEL